MPYELHYSWHMNGSVCHLTSWNTPLVVPGRVVVSLSQLTYQQPPPFPGLAGLHHHTPCTFMGQASAALHAYTLQGGPLSQLFPIDPGLMQGINSMVHDTGFIGHAGSYGKVVRGVYVGHVMSVTRC